MVTNLKHSLISVVIPVYQEGANLENTLDIINDELEGLDDFYELILVDDGSRDNTWEIIQSMAKNNNKIYAIRLSRNFGKEAALCAGLESAKGAAAIVMDGDLQHPPNLISKIVKIWKETNVNIVEAVKSKRGKESLLEKCGSKLFYIIFNRLSGFDLTNASDFKLIDRKVIDAWLSMGEKNLFFRGMIHWLGFKMSQIPFEVAERAGGKSKWSFIKLMNLSLTGIAAFSSIPLHLISVIGSVFILGSIILGGQVFYLKITGQAASGFATVILLLLIIGGTTMISLGIIGEYLAKIYTEVKGRPRYIIEQTTPNRKVK